MKLKTDKDTIQIKQAGEPSSEGYKLSDTAMEHAEKAASSIAMAFHWSDMPEGEAFWSSVHSRLHQLAKRGY
jgi:hypothetical protein